MGCGSCGSGGCSSDGCGRNGGCATGGCNKLNTYDWLGNMLGPDQSEVDNVYEIRFKNTRKGFYRNVNGLRLYIGDAVVVESDRGYDVGVLSLGGVLAELQMRKKRNNKTREDLLRIYRKANEADLELLQKVRDREAETLSRSREIILDLELDMKLSDVEFQGDNAKAIFYYIADHRVDFRELIKILAREFRIRVEMKQIGLRHEAGLVGGIGSCGRELCCSTWLTEFKTVSTSAARYQNLSLNPMKISGLCGRLKCCLNFELDAYLDAIQDFPKVDHILTQKGKAILQKTDIFKGRMWFSYLGETTWYPLPVEKVKEILALNEKGEKPDVLRPGATPIRDIGGGGSREKEFDFVDVVGTELPPLPERGNKKRKKRSPHNRRKKDSRGKGGQNKDQKNQSQNKQKSGSGSKKNAAKPQNKNQRRKQKPRPPANKNKKADSPESGDNQKNKTTQNRNANNRNRKPGKRSGKPSGRKPPQTPKSE
ncbi:MAG: regulatory iron-sulfur-containing complex subunit RicT [Bacteroidota bacterium]